MRIAHALAAASLLAVTAQAQVRTEPRTASFVDPASAPEARLLFGRSGYFMIAGGVVLGGHASFTLERNDASSEVPAGAVRLAAAHDGSVSLNYDGAAYNVAMPAGLACPLGRFVARDGIIAYTIPKYLDPESRMALLRAGVVHHRVAREFDGTRFESLLRAADFAATSKLPASMAEHLSNGLNYANGLRDFLVDVAERTVEPVGSLINTDAEVRYHVYLMDSAHRVEIGGVPLRYFWETDQSGAAGVFAVDVFAQNWPPGTTLSNLAAPTQYDIVNFYQVAGLFRQVHLSNAASFAAFVEQACGSSA